MEIRWRRRSRKGRHAIVWLAAAAAVAIVLLAGGCSASDNKAGGEDSRTADSLQAAPASQAELANAAPAAMKDQAGSTKSAAAQTSGASASASSPGMALPTSAGAFDRKIIYKANITMQVDSYADAQSDIKNKALLAGGYIVQFSENRTANELSGTLTVKIPSIGFTGFIADLEQMKPKSMQQNIQGQDVTEEFVDLTSRLKSKQVMEARLLDFLAKSTKTDELISFSNELGKVQEEIEKIKGRMTYLEQNVAFSTAEIRLYQKLEDGKKAQEETGKSFGSRIVQTGKASTDVMLDILQALLLFLAGALPVLVVLAIIGLPLTVWWRKRRREQALQEERMRRLRQENRGTSDPPAPPDDPASI